MINESKKYLMIGKSEQKYLRDYYNEHCFQLVKKERRYRIQEGDNWCAMFVSVMAHKMGLGAVKFPYEVSVMEQMKIAKERGIFFTDRSKIKPNDLILFDWDKNGWADHVGFVVKVGKDLITSIEGNFQGTVNYRTVSIHSKSIYGFIGLDYGVY